MVLGPPLVPGPRQHSQDDVRGCGWLGLVGAGHNEAATWPGAGAAGIPPSLGPRESKLNPESPLCLPVGQVHCLLAGWRAKGEKRPSEA